MPLPSQSGRPISRHSHMFRRGRKRRGPLAVLFVLLLIVGGFGIWMLSGSGEAEEPTTTPPANDVLASRPEFRDLPVSASLSGSNSSRDTGRPASAEANQLTSPAPNQATPRPSGREKSNSTPPKSAADRRANASGQTDEPRVNRTATSSTPEESSRVVRSPSDSVLRPPSSANEPLPPGHARAMERVRLGMDHLAANRPIDARRTLSDALMTGGLDRATAREVRARLTELNQRLVFSPHIIPGDRFSYSYTIRPGDSLSRIATQEGLAIDWRLIQRINRIPRPEQIRAGQKIKLLTGPFHAVVNKSDYRLDLYLGEGSDRVFVRSYRVGLGEFDSTPEGLFRVRANSKLINPEWTNPRTGERFMPDDPKNPIGERWIGLEGVSEAVKGLGGYGVHGTIEPESIGQQASMGCVRLLAGDVEVIYELFVEETSTVEIVPR